MTACESLIATPLHAEHLHEIFRRHHGHLVCAELHKYCSHQHKYPYAGGDEEERRQNVTDTREFRKFERRLREGRCKEGRVRQTAREMTRSPAVIITEELGKNPQEEMIGLEEKAKKGVKKKVGKRELRHRIAQTPFKKLVRAVEEKARETSSLVVYVSPYRNSRVCPIHFSLLKNGGGWHTLYCPRGHVVERDAVAVLNLLWKTTPAGWVKTVWWGVKEARKRLDKGDCAEGSCEEGEPHHPAARCTRRLDLAHGAEGQLPVARGAGPGRPHDPHRRGL
jgi:IS605 OrfB family transposase